MAAMFASGTTDQTVECVTHRDRALTPSSAHYVGKIFFSVGLHNGGPQVSCYLQQVPQATDDTIFILFKVFSFFNTHQLLY